MTKRKGSKRLERKPGETVSEAKARRKRELAAKRSGQGSAQIQVDPIALAEAKAGRVLDKDERADIRTRAASGQALARMAGETPSSERVAQSGGPDAIQDSIRRAAKTHMAVRLLEDIPTPLRQMAAKGKLNTRELAAAGHLISDYKFGYLGGMITAYQERVDGGGGSSFGDTNAARAAARDRYGRALAGLQPELRGLVAKVVIEGVSVREVKLDRASRFGARSAPATVSYALSLALGTVSDFYAMSVGA